MSTHHQTVKIIIIYDSVLYHVVVRNCIEFEHAHVHAGTIRARVIEMGCSCAVCKIMAISFARAVRYGIGTRLWMWTRSRTVPHRSAPHRTTT